MNPLGRWLLIGCALVAGSGCRTVPLLGAWSALATEPYPGKQDDIFFLNEQLGWYVNGEGNIYKTSDGGRSWTRKLQKPGTYFRSVGFVDASHGYAGNLGPGYFEGVTDSVLLYETWDGGETWAPAKDFPFPAGAGVCSIDILHAPSGQAFVHVAGRVGGPAFLARSTDGGAHWVLVDLRPLTAMILDVHFVDPDTGFIAGASDADAEKSHARVLKTTNGGQSWTSVYESTRPFEITWKESFPTAEVGYVTVQNYNPDAAVSRRLVARLKTAARAGRNCPWPTIMPSRSSASASPRPKSAGWELLGVVTRPPTVARRGPG